MRRLFDFLVPVLLLVVLASACGPASPSPAQPTPTVAAAVIPTTAQVAQAVPTPTSAPPTAAPATSVASTGCNPPAGWSPYTVKPGDTLVALAKQVNLKPEELMRSNCLASSLISAGGTLYLPLQSCTASPPTDWRLYTVRSGDTLFSLATTRDTTVPEVKRVNCLVSDSLEVGSQLYLPPLVVVLPPTAAAPAAAPASVPQPPPPTPCSPFSCPSVALPPLVVPNGAPNGAGYTPCDGTVGEPWLDVFTNFMQIGDRLYVYVCEFPPLALGARVVFPDGKKVQLVPVMPVPANPDSTNGNAQAVIEWPALPGQPVDKYDSSGRPADKYTLYVAAADGTEVKQDFYVNPPDRQHILVVPEVGPAGTVFEVYYIYFEPGTPIDAKLYGEDVPVEKQDHQMTGRQIMKVAIGQDLPYSTGKGWAKQELKANPGDPPAGYAIVVDLLHRSQALFWLR